jgi:phage terminase Nu1 subunit (DNA packaging protein)
VGLWKYLKTAFLNRWNLLAFLGAGGFALLSGHPDVALPVIVAAELAYLGLLGTHPKFQKSVEAQQAALRRAATTQSTGQTLQRILHSLPRDMMQRFQDLRQRCLELRQIATDLKQPGDRVVDETFEQSQLAGLDRLLWIFLRLLYTHFALSRFLQKTDNESIQQDIERIEARLAQLPPDPQELQQQRIRKTLEDNLATSQARLANFKKAMDNLQLVELQLDQLENRIHSLSEMAVNRQEPDFISSQVDLVATSMIQTEQTMNELRFATGLDAATADTPPLLRPVQAQILE